ncbi:MAG: FAD/NAD(P)-binding protein [Verrucomicrobia bacterium]|nr:FAD/NAD(P)-binding protein [Verrucomicrobiota bacterium]
MIKKIAEEVKLLIPSIYQVKEISHETADVFTLKLAGKPIPFLPGQFNMLYHFGIGEVAISIAGWQKDLVHTIRAVGSVTNQLQKLQIGDEIGVRGPFGTAWPLSDAGGEVLVIAGGIGLATLKPALMQFASAKRRDVTLLFGAKHPDAIFYKKDLENWKNRGIKVEVTVDHADISWRGEVGVVTSLIKKNLKDPKNALVLICGPEVMIKFAVQELLEASVEEKNIHISLERNMQCAVGSCGHCQFGPYFLCKDGPVLSYQKLKHWLMIKEL